ncbi:hypothetical protein IV203_018238 [Nitzschia inconspicua]|uniref:DUF6824 domain-containing protein n=1 Tax=Nitzschia inconspicua TaxID=303405 RepID=A0A9K3M111_9STRA|nr:hypothetical protein IV203_018238 [Nitzschia inconspicua]
MDNTENTIMVHLQSSSATTFNEVGGDSTHNDVAKGDCVASQVGGSCERPSDCAHETDNFVQVPILKHGTCYNDVHNIDSCPRNSEDKNDYSHGTVTDRSGNKNKETKLNPTTAKRSSLSGSEKSSNMPSDLKTTFNITSHSLLQKTFSTATITSSSSSAESAPRESPGSSPQLISKEDKPILPESTSQYNSRDVLLGRGVPIQRHPGNKRMHRIVDLYRERYRTASRSDKTLLVRTTIQDIRKGGTRFLKRVDGKASDIWMDASEDIVYEKVSHALRGNGGGHRKDDNFSSFMSSPRRTSMTANGGSDQDEEVTYIVSRDPSTERAATLPDNPFSKKSVFVGTASQSLPQIPQVQRLLSYVLPGSLAGSHSNLVAPSQPSSFASLRGLAVTQLLQSQLLSQQLVQQQQEQQRLCLQVMNAREFTACLDLLLGSNRGVGILGGSSLMSPVKHTSFLPGLLMEQRSQPQPQSDTSHVLKLLLSTNSLGALDHLLQQRQQDQDMVRRLEQELAGRQLAFSMANIVPTTSHDQRQPPPTFDQNELLSTLLLANAMTSMKPDWNTFQNKK